MLLLVHLARGWQAAPSHEPTSSPLTWGPLDSFGELVAEVEELSVLLARASFLSSTSFQRTRRVRRSDVAESLVINRTKQLLTTLLS